MKPRTAAQREALRAAGGDEAYLGFVLSALGIDRFTVDNGIIRYG